MLEKVFGDVASWCWSYLAAKSFHVRVDVDGPACPLHRPTIHSYQVRVHGLMLGAALSHRVVGSDDDLRVCEASRLGFLLVWCLSKYLWVPVWVVEFLV
jgi:hypothetical protein